MIALSNMEYYFNHGGEHYSLHDMIDVDINAELELYHPHADVKPLTVTNSNNMQQIASNQNKPMPYSQEQNNVVQLDHGFLQGMTQNVESNWIHGGKMNGQVRSHDNGNIHHHGNPQSGNAEDSVQTTLSTRMLSLPNSVQISGGTIQYITTPNATQQVYVAPVKSPLSQHHTLSNGKTSYQQNGNGNVILSPNSGNDNPYPKPTYSYSCLIAMALKNSKHGSLPVAEIYNFMTRHFPYFKTAPDGWKNSVRHNLSLNKCFEKIENPNADGTNSRKGCLWGLNPAKMKKMDEEIIKWHKKDPNAIKRAMAHPDILEMLEQGQEQYLAAKFHHNHQPVVSSASSGHQTQQQTAVHQPHSPSIRSIGSPMLSHLSSVGPQHLTILPGGYRLEAINVQPAIAADKLDDNHQLFCRQMEHTLDPQLSDIVIQHSIWDDLPSDMLEIPLAHSPGFQMSPHRASPAVSPGQLSNVSAISNLQWKPHGNQTHQDFTSRTVSAS